MARPRKIAQTLDDNNDTSEPIHSMPLETLEDYRAYNREARRLNKQLRIARYPIKQCPEDLHPKERVILGRVDGQSNLNPIPVLLDNQDICFKETLECGKEYDLPYCVIDHLEGKGYPVWGWVTLPDGSRETREINKNPRFTVKRVRIA
jgi:hypothetical protein